MNMEIKVGDKVRVSKDAPKLLFTRSICNYPEYVFEVRVIEDDLADIFYGAGKIPLAAFVIPTKYLIKVEDEAKFEAGEIVRYRYDGKLYIVECKTGKYYYALRQVGGDIMMHDVLEPDLELVTEPKQGWGHDRHSKGQRKGNNGGRRLCPCARRQWRMVADDNNYHRQR